MSVFVRPHLRDWARDAIGQIGRRLDRPRPPTRRERKLLIVHLDGVPRRLLEELVQNGEMPFLASLVRSGAYNLDTAFWGSPASTPFFQAGLLYGLRHPNLPAYSWYDRELGRKVRMNAPKDTLAIEQRLGLLAQEDSLLEGGGTAYLSLFRANAENRLSMSSLADWRSVLKTAPESFRNIRAAPRQSVGTYLRGVVGDLWESAHDVWGWVRQVKDWRHEPQYLLNRFFLISLVWNLARTRAEIDMVAGVPAIYLVYGNYDEVSHRRGPFSPQARRELRRVDSALEELYAIGHSVEQPYDIYLLTDHGHVDSTPFEKRQSQKLERYLLEGEAPPLPADLERGLLDGRQVGTDGAAALDEPVVIEAGNFSHVYLSRGKAPLEALELLARHRNVLARAVSQPDIGIVAVRRGDSAVAIVGGGVYGPDEIDRAPLPVEFSRAAVADLLRELPHMATAGDLVLYGQAVTKTGTVGFAWEFGSHGGLTRIETDSVICWPSEAPLDLSALGHCTQLHERLSEVYRA